MRPSTHRFFGLVALSAAGFLVQDQAIQAYNFEDGWLTPILGVFLVAVLLWLLTTERAMKAIGSQVPVEVRRKRTPSPPAARHAPAADGAWAEAERDMQAARERVPAHEAYIAELTTPQEPQPRFDAELHALYSRGQSVSDRYTMGSLPPSIDEAWRTNHHRWTKDVVAALHLRDEAWLKAFLEARSHERQMAVLAAILGIDES